MITREVQKRKKKERENCRSRVFVLIIGAASFLVRRFNAFFFRLFPFFFVFGFYRSPLTFDV